MDFTELNLCEPLLQAVRKQGYRSPSPIQEKAIPHILAGRDVMGCAQTGTGKTAAFALPILQRMIVTRASHTRRTIRTLVLAPTRELAAQIGDSFNTYGSRSGLTCAVIFGGVSQGAQIRMLRAGADIVVATPGRLLDLMKQGFITLRTVEFFVLDEGDRMLDMGFINDIRRIVSALPKKRQTLLFSATLPPAIRELQVGILDRPVEVSVTRSATTVESITQSVYFVEKYNKPALLISLLEKQDIARVLVFTRTKHGADKVVEKLVRAAIPAEAIHGNKSQGQRERALHAFGSGRSRVLVATDIASRGLDIDHISHVVNYDLPHESESYVHRIGRTGRAGAAGVALSFCSQDERDDLYAIEKLIRMPLAVESDHPFRSVPPSPAAAPMRRSFGPTGRSMPRRMSGGFRKRSAS